MKKIAIVSGGFDPLHVGHIELFNKSKRLLGADELIAILNTDDFLIRKKKEYFMPFDERRDILENLSVIDLVFPSVDEDETVCESLRELRRFRPVDALFFCNGGDRTDGTNTPEHSVCAELSMNTIYGLGKKIQSSSWLIQ
jgi:cytidyltransferase-like protein